jgi:hypothetical protein
MIFCWLPPESVPVIRSGSAGRSSSASICSRVTARSRRSFEHGPPARAREGGERHVLEDRLLEQEPWLLRSSGESPTPAPTAEFTEPGRRRSPLTETLPDVARRAP